uniref:GPI inositol-deacylase n=1 Tax=Eucampia antarctica TaxID=49252 RepID=A0A7S2SI00_9STRA|mmetsp:Transcript_8572/g.8137  ORF Transcript_8572/g.8137 Transcript_8572/m.8137 type:complete len:344 (+) Transcript_8572:24-1055(+)
MEQLWLVFVVCVLVTAFPSGAFQLNKQKLHRPLASLSSSLVGSDEKIDKAVETNSSEKNEKTAVLLCPAQFCVPADYEVLMSLLKKENPSISTCKVTPLPRTEWIKVAKQLPTKPFLDASLSCYKTLDWYFDAMEQALSQIFAEEGNDVKICIVGHSIGGWVARAYLGGLSGSSTAVYRLAQKQISSFITLGTPHSSPDSALVDQTRGLLKEVERSSSCSSQALADRGIDLTCVGSSGLSGKIFTSDLEEIVAATSYFPLIGSIGENVRGDGIIPEDLAFMEEPARRITIEKCYETGSPVRHAHVLPTPWNLWDGEAPSIPLPDDFVWYGSNSVVGEWSKFIC